MVSHLASDRSLKRIYNSNNKKYFNGELPDAVIWWEPLGAATFGDCLYLEDQKIWRIRLNSFCGGWRGVWKLTLLHEQAHIHLAPYRLHGKKFDKEMLRLAEIGAFKGLW